MTDSLIRMQCPIWERSSEPGKGFRGRIAIDSNKKRIQVFDDEKWAFENAFPELYVPLAGADVKLQPVKSRNNTHKMGKITVRVPTATVFPSKIHAGEVFSFILLSFDDCETVIRILNSWKTSK
jgi:hypothetical protein